MYKPVRTAVLAVAAILGILLAFHLSSRPKPSPPPNAEPPLTTDTARHILWKFLQNPPDPRLKLALPVLESPAASEHGWGDAFLSVGWQARLDSKTWIITFPTTTRGEYLTGRGQFVKNDANEWDAQLTTIDRFSQLP